eukprot:m.228706 g.228706  ORF g.228706 m.228706 type:complete len:432 (+) comp33544_c5_seq1:186-1481(+)
MKRNHLCLGLFVLFNLLGVAGGASSARKIRPVLGVLSKNPDLKRGDGDFVEQLGLYICPFDTVCIGVGCERVPASKVPTSLRIQHQARSGYGLSCRYCHCYRFDEDQLRVLRPTQLDPNKMYYHLHVSKTGGTTFEHTLRRRIAAPNHMNMCDQVLNISFKLPFKFPPYFAQPKDLRLADCNIVSAEGRRSDVNKQFLNVAPEMILFFRNPTLRTWSQWNHDKKYEVQQQASPGEKTVATDAVSSSQGLLANVYRNTSLLTRLQGRYGNWQLERQSDVRLGVSNSISPEEALGRIKSQLATLDFIGISDSFRVSLCLFYFMHSLFDDFAHCMERPISAYNAACYENGETNKDCVKGQSFTNKFQLSEHAEHALLKDMKGDIPREEKEAIETHTSLDRELYFAALDLFTKRVEIMAEATQKQFMNKVPLPTQ